MQKGETNIDEISANKFSIKIYLNKEYTLQILAEQPLQFVQVFDMSGRLVKELRTKEVSATINLANVPRGVYLIKTAVGSGKVIR
jgi:hypothetical protein